MPPEFGELHVEVQKAGIKKALDMLSGDYDI